MSTRLVLSVWRGRFCRWHVSTMNKKSLSLYLPLLGTGAEAGRPSQRMTSHHRDLFEEIVENLPDWEGRLKSGLSVFCAKRTRHSCSLPSLAPLGGVPQAGNTQAGTLKPRSRVISDRLPLGGDKKLAASNPGKTRTLIPNPNPNLNPSPNGIFCDVII